MKEREKEKEMEKRKERDKEKGAKYVYNTSSSHKLIAEILVKEITATLLMNLNSQNDPLVLPPLLTSNPEALKERGKTMGRESEGNGTRTA